MIKHLKRYLLLVAVLMYGIAFEAHAEYKTTPLNAEIKDYVSKKYKTVGSKKLVLYDEQLAQVNCPHAAAFSKIFNKQRQRNDFRAAYSFQKQNHPTSSDTLTPYNFAKLCGVVCVVSLKNNWIYSIGNSFAEEKATELSKALSALKSKE